MNLEPPPAKRVVRLQRRIKTITKRLLLIYWLFTALLSAASLIIVNSVLKTLNTEKGFPYWILIIPAFSFVLLIVAIFETLRWRKFGESFFNMFHFPLREGEDLKGEIETSVKLPETNFCVKLTYINRIVKGTGKYRTTEDRVLWEGMMRNVKQLPDMNSPLSRIPVHFRIPDNCPDTRECKPRNQIIWQLEASAELPGIDYNAVFEIPIFRTAPISVSPKKSQRSRRNHR
jgi:hypothetical protein